MVLQTVRGSVPLLFLNGELHLHTAIQLSLYQSPVTGSDDVVINASLGGLQAATTYHYRLRANNANANTGWEFVNWSGDAVCVNDPYLAQATVTMPAGNVMLTANFEEKEDTPGTGLMPDDEIAEATFVDINFSAFPVLPEYVIPGNNTLFVSISGNDTTGDGSENNPYRSIDKAIHEASENYTIIVREGQYAESFESSIYPGYTDDHRGLAIN